MAVKVSHVGICCKDPISTERFYTRHFGFRRTRVFTVGGEQVAMIRSGDFYIELFPAKGNAPGPMAGGAGPEYPGWRHLAFAVDDVDAKLAEMGDEAKITLGPLDLHGIIPGWRIVWIADPDGNILEISQGYRDEELLPPFDEE